MPERRVAGLTRCPYCMTRLTLSDSDDGDLVIISHIERACTHKPADWHKPVWARADFK